MSDSDDRPEVIRAKAEAKAMILEARSKLHPAAQVIYTFLDQIGSILGGLGCLFIILIAVLLFFGVDILAFIR
jgi:hypothetical protein